MKPVDDNAAGSRGRVAFVGAGPGAADLITRRGADALQRATVVVHDTLVPAEVLAVAAADARRVCIAPPQPGGPDAGTATGRLLVELAGQGGLVVRLKGGDPTVFARLAEELAPLRQAGIPVEIVPGVTAALAAAAAAVVPLTSRAAASSLTILTGHEATAKGAPAGDFAALAALPGTLAVYMGVEQAPEWSRRLVEAGLPGSTPVTIVSRASWPDQRIGTTTLASCAADVVGQAWQAPAVLIVGGSSTDRPAVGPLAGRRIVVTRPTGQGDELAGLLEAAGGACVAVPLVEIVAPASWHALDEAVRAVSTYDWIVLASTNGVRAFVDRLRAAGRDARALGTARLAAIGPATCRALATAGLVADLSPATFSSEGLVAALGDAPPRSRFLIVRADQSRGVLRRELEARGHHVDEVVAYCSRPVTALDAAARAALDRAPIDWVTVTSPSIARTAVRVFGDRLPGWRIASLSPVTSAALRDEGIEPTVEAIEATAPSLVAAILARESSVTGPGGSLHPPAAARVDSSGPPPGVDTPDVG
jgi:uroporphyrinogen III methyltransferase/synthase